MEKFEVLEHKADLKIRAVGKTKEELFRHCLEAMAKTQSSKSKLQKSVKRTIKIKSLDSSALLVDFLSEVLYQTQVNKEIYDDIKFKKFTNNEIEGELKGLKVERFDEDIKAVTHHNLNVAKNRDGVWEAVILFDI